MEARISVGLLHPNRLWREVLGIALSLRPNLMVVRQASRPEELWVHSDTVPRVVLIDLGLPEREGLQQTQEVSRVWPQVGILLTGMTELESDVLAACEAGATAYLPNDASFDQLVQHLEAVAIGETPCTPKVAALLFSRVRDGAREMQRLRSLGLAHLTRRELEIIALIDQGLSNKEIAVRLDIEVQTVKNHVHNVLDKLELDGRQAAVRFARERGLLPSTTTPTSRARRL